MIYTQEAPEGGRRSLRWKKKGDQPQAGVRWASRFGYGIPGHLKLSNLSPPDCYKQIFVKRG